MTLKISISVYGCSFATRMRAREIIKNIWERIVAEQPDDVVLDFTDISVISGSFADEFIGELQKRSRASSRSIHKIQIQNAKPFVQEVLKTIIARRSKATRVSPQKTQNEAVFVA